MLKLILFFLSITLVTSLVAQTSGSLAPPVKKMAVTELMIGSSVYIQRMPASTLNDFITLSGSEFLNRDFSGYNEITSTGVRGKSMFCFNAGIKFSDKDLKSYKNNVMLRIGFNFISGRERYLSYEKVEQYRMDTLTSSQSSNVYYIDSVFAHNWNAEYASQEVDLSASLFFRYKPENRWSVYGGFGLAGGITFNNRTNMFHYETKSSKSYNQAYEAVENGYNGSPGVIEEERIKNKNGYTFYFGLPMGLDFRLGKKNEMMRAIHLFYEFRPVFSFFTIPELGTIFNSGLQHGLGFRFSWN